MNREQATEVLAMIKIAYQNTYKNLTKNDANNMILLYQSIFAEENAEAVKLAVKAHIATSKWSPTVADIRELIHASVQITADAAWGQIMTAIKKFGQYQECEAIASMSADVATVCKRLGYKTLCQSNSQMADRAHFLKIWEQYSSKKLKQEMLPKQIAKNIKLLTAEIKTLES